MMNMSNVPRLQILSEDQVVEIHNATLDLLQRVGTDVHNSDALQLLRSAGCQVEGCRVKIPSYIVEEAIRSAPSRFTLFSREGDTAMLIEGRRSYFGSAPTAPYQLDLETEEKRPTSAKDIADTARIMDALPNIDFIMPLGSIQDVPANVADLYEFTQTVFETSKPIAFLTRDAEGLNAIFEMAATITGGMQALQQKPFIVPFPQSITPLVHSKEAVDLLLGAAAAGIPCAYTSCPILGLTTPVTLSATLVIANMEVLTGVVITQLKRRGTPIIIGTVTNGLNVRTVDVSIGAPELPLGVAAYADIARFYRIPSWGTAGLSDSKLPDEQAAIEGTLGCMLNVMAGLNMIHDIGYLDMALTDSIEQVVMMDEVVAMVRRIWRGVPVDAESLAREVIANVGPGGNFIAEEHTARLFREELWLPTIMNRDQYDKWVETGRQSMRDRVRAKARELLKTHKPRQLDEKVKARVIEILNTVCEQRLKKVG